MTTVTAKGHNGTATFDGTFVTITRTGFLARMTLGSGEKRIPISSVTAVQWKQPNAVLNGYIAFTISGGSEKQSRAGAAVADASRDENAVVVTKAQAPAFAELRAAVDSAIAARHVPQTAAAPASGADEITRMAELHAQGILSDDEFVAAKAKLLGL